MPYRNELDAARAHATVLEKELQELKKKTKKRRWKMSNPFTDDNTAILTGIIIAIIATLIGSIFGMQCDMTNQDTKRKAYVECVKHHKPAECKISLER